MKCPMCGNDDPGSIETKLWNRKIEELKRGALKEKGKTSQLVYRCVKCGITWTEGSRDHPAGG